jgi:hypothetical protein
MEADLVADLERLELRHHALDVPHRDADDPFEQFVGVEPRPAEAELDDPRPDPVRIGG